MQVPSGSTSLPGERRKNPYLRRKHDEIAGALASTDNDGLKVLLENVRPADLAEMIQRFAPDDQLRVMMSLDLRRGTLVLKRARTAVAADILAILPLERAADLLDWMAVDDRASLLEMVSRPLREDLLQEMEKRTADEVRASLAWPAQTAGRLVQTHAVRLPPDITIAEAMTLIRQLDSKVEKLNDGYVLDERGVLIGVVSLRQLVTAAPERTVREVMTADVVSVRPTDDQEFVAQIFAKYDFLALPVVTSEGVLIGIITIDDILDILYHEHTEDMLNLGGIQAQNIANETYFSARIGQVVKSRVWWLLLLFVAGTATGTVLKHFEEQLRTTVALSIFIPLLIGTGGNAGSQTVSAVIRGIALGEIRTDDWWRVLLREMLTGCALGLLLGLIAFARAGLWHTGLQIAIAVAVSIVAICIWSTAVGAVIPIVAQKFGLDPTVVSAPMITTLVDTTGLLVYLTTASFILRF